MWSQLSTPVILSLWLEVLNSLRREHLLASSFSGHTKRTLYTLHWLHKCCNPQSHWTDTNPSRWKGILARVTGHIFLPWKSRLACKTILAPGIGTSNPLLELQLSRQNLHWSNKALNHAPTRVYAIPTTPYSITYCKVTCLMHLGSMFHVPWQQRNPTLKTRTLKRCMLRTGTTSLVIARGRNWQPSVT